MTEEVTISPVDANGVTPKSKTFVAIILWILTIIYCVDAPVVGIVTALLSWYWLAPYLARYARDHGRDADWGFAIGACFAILGVIVYWIYEYIVRDRFMNI